MTDKKFTIASDSGITISASAAEKLIASADGLAALLYIYLLKNNGESSVAKAAITLKAKDQDIEKAFETLIGLKLVTPRDEPVKIKPVHDELPSYTVQDIKNELENGTLFPALVSEVQNCLGRILSSDDLMRLFGIYDSLGLPPEVILLLVNHCVSDFRHRYNGQRLPTMRYIEKAAFSWERDGICTLELAEEFLRRYAERRSRSGEIKSVLNLGSRPLTASEQKYIDAWADMGFPPESIEIAYDRTILRTGKLTWKYMNSILKSWKSKNLITPDEVSKENLSATPHTSPKNSSDVSGTVTADDIQRMRRLIKDMNEQQEADE